MKALSNTAYAALLSSVVLALGCGKGAAATDATDLEASPSSAPDTSTSVVGVQPNTPTNTGGSSSAVATVVPANEPAPPPADPEEVAPVPVVESVATGVGAPEPTAVESSPGIPEPAPIPAEVPSSAPTFPADSGAQSTLDAGTPAAFQGKELFILFGQSNMSGMSPMPAEPWVINENISFMVQYDCPSLGQTKDEWLPAQPPLHGCQWATGGIGLGLADHFGVAMAEAWQDSQIGLIPNAIPAVTIDIFMKDGPSPGGGLKALPDGYTSAYTLMVDRVKEAQKLGRVRGILLHQGESDYNQGFGEEWLGKLATVVADLRADLELGEEVPFLAGQIPPGNYSGHNVYVDQVPSEIPNSAVVSSEGTAIHDVAHFDEESARIMGQRYAETFLELTSPP